MAFDVIQGSTQTLADVLNGAVVFDQLALDGAPVGGLTLEFSDPAVTVTFSGSPGAMRSLPEIATELMSGVTGLAAEIRIGTGSASISIWRETGFTLAPTGTANPVLGFDTVDPVVSEGIADVTRIRGFSQGATEGYYALVLSDEPGAADPGIGDVDGPAIATANAVPRFNGTTGKVIKNSSVLISDAGSITLPDGATVDGVDVSTLVYAPVASMAALSATPNSVAGLTLFMLSVRDYWVSSNRSSPPVVDNSKVIAHASGGNWRWERLCIPHQSWALQASIYVDSAVGNDDWDGSQATAGGGLVGPLRTNAELVRRLGYDYRPQINQTIFATGDCGPLYWSVNGAIAANKTVHYRGTLTPRVTTTISSVVNAAPATNVDSSFHGDTGWTTANEIDKLVIDSSGLSTWIIEQGAGAADAVTSAWQSIDVSSAGQFPTSPPATNTANGRTVTSYDHATTLSEFGFTVIGQRALVFSDVFFNPSGNFRFFFQNALSGFNRCKFGASGAFGGGAVYFNGCMWTTGSSWNHGNEFMTRSFVNGGLSRVAFSTGVTALGLITFRNNLVFTGVGPGVCSQNSRWYMDGFCIRKVTSGALMTFTGLGNARINGALWGANTTTGPIAALERGSRITTNQGAAAITVQRGATSDFTFGGDTTARAYDKSTGLKTAARTLTWANLEATVATTGFGNTMGDEGTDCYVLKT